MSQFASALPAEGPRSVRPLLWKGGVGLLAFLISAVGASRLMGPKADMIGTPGSDFIPSYMAGAFVRSGHADWLMDLPREAEFQHHIRLENHLDVFRPTGPWLNPPYYAWLFVPLARLPFHQALLTWFGLNLLLTALAAGMLAHMLPSRAGWRTWGLIPLLLICSFPYLQVIASEQNTCLSLFLLCATVSCWRQKRPLLAGLIAGLLLFKPQLGAVLIVALCWSLGRRAIVGVAITATSLLASAIIAMPGALWDYLTKLPTVIPWMKAGGEYLWERQITWQGFWRLALQHHATGPAPAAVRELWPIGAVLVGAMLAYTIHRARRMEKPAGDRLIAAVVAAMPLLMPYYMDYDLLLLAVPAVLLAAEIVKADRIDPLGKWLARAWMALYVWAFFNAVAGNILRINLLVPMLSIMAIAQCIRVLREDRDVAAAVPHYPIVARFRAALASVGERAA